MFYHQSAAATRRSYQISLTWLWLTRARVTDSGQLSSAGFEPTAVLTFGLRVRRLNHSATRSLRHACKAFLLSLPGPKWYRIHTDSQLKQFHLSQAEFQSIKCIQLLDWPIRGPHLMTDVGFNLQVWIKCKLMRNETQILFDYKRALSFPRWLLSG